MSPNSSRLPLQQLLASVSACNLCQDKLPHPPRPVLRANANAGILIIGQAPGTRVHATGIPWNDPSGRRLREWMGVDEATFYDSGRIAIVPMGFCFPGKGRSGDLPPRPECAPQWHAQILAQLPHIRCTLLIGQYAQRYYLPDLRGSVADRVARWREFAPRTFVLPHPSPRNTRWLQLHGWFQQDVVPVLQQTLADLLSQDLPAR